MSIQRPSRIEIGLKEGVLDARGEHVAHSVRSHLGLEAGQVATLDVFTFDVDLTPEQIEVIRAQFTDPVIQESAAGRLESLAAFDWMVLVGFKPGVTDNVGRTAKAALADLLGRRLGDGESVHTSTAYIFRDASLTREQAEMIGRDLLANPLIETVQAIDWAQWQAGEPGVHVPKFDGETKVHVGQYDLSGSDEDLVRISREGTLSLSLAEMKAIRDYFTAEAATPARQQAGLTAQPSDIELETLAQTWSEHCKHKIFSGTVHYTDDQGNTQTIRSLYKTFIKGATHEVAKVRDWLVSVFHDNAGVIDFNERMDLVYKVETHNSPSALEPYGGAMTGIVGCNRDPLGTGMGAELLVNVWGYCFASPFTKPQDVPEGVMHPRRLRDGVHRGVIDGGNQSGIPYGVGWEFFDPRYLAKPMVYCGTLGKLPKCLPDGRKAAEKKANAGDLIVMIGGRIGKDGIHGATFSSEELHKDSPVQAVQIGDPITQKKMSDFLIEARDAGLYNAVTDNGAGGLSSSVGEMAEGPGGARIDLAKAPLKYAGLQPWEIWLSEAQERMTLAVSTEQIDALKALAKRRDVELNVLGEFNESGYLDLQYGGKTVGLISMQFLHEGCPEMVMQAKWAPPAFAAPELPAAGADLTADLHALLARLNVASKEFKSRQYDHEVKGRTIIKPFIGTGRDVPSDATIFLAEYGGREGIVLSKGFNAHYSDLDCYWMIASIVDEAVRRILAVGGRLDYIAGMDNFCWPDPVESVSTPDGQYKLAQLVRANQALFDVCVAWGVPLISGKDSMKNDSTRGGRKISIPPSVLFSAVGKIDDIARALTMEPKAAGDKVYVIGATRDELGASEYAHLLNERKNGPSDQLSPAMTIGGQVPQLDPKAAQALYGAVEKAAREGQVRSLHAVTLGGLAASLAQMSMGAQLGLDVDLGKAPGAEGLSDPQAAFSQSNGRFIATVAPEKAAAFEAALAGHLVACIGTVEANAHLKVKGPSGALVIDAATADLKQSWKKTLDNI